MKDNFYWYWICNIKGLWTAGIKSLLDYFQSPKNVFDAEADELANAIKYLRKPDKNLLENILYSKDINRIIREYSNLEERGISFISQDDALYPDKFKNIKDRPYSFYLKGNIHVYERLLNNPSVAIVGARECTNYGLSMAKKIGFDLAAHGVNIISGMARGIDSSGLYGCINAGGIGVGILGCGVDVCYPRENIELYEEISRSGILMSEYPMGTPPNAWQFPLRNRMISALADIVLVVEARKKSGSLITVEYANEQGRDVMAIPGRVSDKLSEGCNKVIRDGGGIVTCTKDILEALYLLNYYKKDDCEEGSKDKKGNITLEKEIESLYSIVDLIPKSSSEIARESGLSIEKVMAGLIKLQMMGYVEEPSKNQYMKKI